VHSSCKAKAKNGKPCRAAAMEGGLCFFHANPNKASEMGRIGGKARHVVSLNDFESVPGLDTVKALGEFTARLIRDVGAGKVKPRIASGIAPLLNLQLRLREVKEYEAMEELRKKISSLEQQLSNTQRILDGKSSMPEWIRSKLSQTLVQTGEDTANRCDQAVTPDTLTKPQENTASDRLSHKNQRSRQRDDSN
jgi:hypothetical protein